MDLVNQINTMGDLAFQGGFNPILGLVSLLLAFVLGQVSAWTYVYTHQGLSYSRAFVQSIILLTMIVTMAMMVVGSNIVIAFGLIGAMSVIRFRNILKDTRDTAFIFFALITGMACGTTHYSLAILSSVVMLMVLLYLHLTSFGSRHTCDGFLRFNIQPGDNIMQTVHQILDCYCRTTHLVSQRYQETGYGEVAFRLIMRDPRMGEKMVEEMQGIEQVSNVTFVLHEEQAEV